jgi:CubicO group peptidase (beta-lactamase class C family)
MAHYAGAKQQESRLAANARHRSLEKRPRKCRSRNRFSWSAFLTIICFVVFHHPLTLAAQTATKLNVGKALDQYLTSLERFGFSCQVLVARNGRVLLNKGYGLADVDNREPVSTRTLYNIASLSKQFTAVAILDLERRDKLRVSDSISKFLADVPEDKRAITIRQLLTHTAGVDDDYAGYSRHPYLTKEEFLHSALARPLASKPGDTFTYSNDGYTFLAAIIESASGETYESYLQNHLFVPAGMKDTGFVGELGNGANRLARTYDGLHESDQARNWSGGLGASGIVSNTSDLFRWYRAIRGTRILNAMSAPSSFVRTQTKREYR